MHPAYQDITGQQETSLHSGKNLIPGLLHHSLRKVKESERL